MKKPNKLALLLGAAMMSLTACSEGSSLLCLETSNTYQYETGTCYQVSRGDSVDSFYLINLAFTDESGDETYDITWNTRLKPSYFVLTGGLKGKTVSTVSRYNSHVMKVNVKGICDDVYATYGYVKVRSEAFTAVSKRAKDVRFIIGYVSIGEAQGLVTKPADIPNE